MAFEDEVVMLLSSVNEGLITKLMFLLLLPCLHFLLYVYYGNTGCGVLCFQTGGTKLERFLPKNQHTQRKLLNFENWVNGEVSNIGHHFE